MGGLQINAEWRQIATQKSTTLASQGCAHCTLLINFGDVQLWALAHYEGSYDRQSVQSELEGLGLIQIDLQTARSREIVDVWNGKTKKESAKTTLVEALRKWRSRE
jgi:hypothetical protein